MPFSPEIPLPTSAAGAGDSASDAFIARWKGQDGGERSNYQLFISELCDLLGVPRPYPSSSDNTENAYIFERSVEMRGGEEGRRQKEEGRSGRGETGARSRGSSRQAGTSLEAQQKEEADQGQQTKDQGHSPQSPPNQEQRTKNQEHPKACAFGYIDCYKRGAFVFETKQGVEKKDREALSEIGREREAKRRTGHGVRGTASWDTALIKARNQADRYARNLPASEGRPPFLIVADVGHCIELYSEFTRSGGIYTPFPADRTSRIMLDDLRRPEIRERLRLVWTDPLSLDPSRRTAAVTREISAKLAALAKSLEKDGHDPQLAAYFLMRCIFTMFSEDVELIPKGSFSEMLKSLRGQVNVVPAMLENLWKAMDEANSEVQISNVEWLPLDKVISKWRIAA